MKEDDAETLTVVSHKLMLDSRHVHHFPFLLSFGKKFC